MLFLKAGRKNYIKKSLVEILKCSNNIKLQADKMSKMDNMGQEEHPLPRYVQDVLSKHNISLPLGEG